MTSLAQDDKGYMWVGTSNGIQCYDMYEFIDERGFEGYDRIYIDRHGRKWMGGNWGVDLRDGWRDEKVKHLQIVNDSMLFNVGYPRWIHEDSKQRLWIKVIFVNGETKYYFFDEARERFLPYDSILPSANNLTGIVRESGGNLWVGTANGLIYYDDEAKAYRFPNDPQFPWKRFPRASEPIHSLYPAGDGKMVVVVWSNKPWSLPYLYLVDNRGSVLFEYSPGDVREVIVDDNKNIWVAGDILIRIDGKSSAMETVALPDNSGVINAASIDREGNIWLGTQHGILIFEPEQRFEDRKNVNVDGVSYGGETISLMRTFDNIVVAGTWGGDHLYFYDANLKPIKCIDGFSRKEFADAVSFPVWSLLESSDRSIWIGGQHGDLVRVNRKNRKLEKFDRQIFKQHTIRAIHEDFQHNIWFSTQGGWVLKRDANTKVISEVGQYSLDFALFINDGPFLWASSGANLLRIDPSDNSIEKYTMKLGRPRDNVIVRLFKIVEVTADQLTLNSSEGLLEFSKSSKQFSPLKINTRYFKEGTVISNYSSIETIGSGKYLASLASGQIVRSENRLMSSLLTKNTFVSNSSAKLSDGCILFGTETGFTLVKTSFIGESTGMFQAPSINAVFLQNRAMNVDSVMRFGLTLNYNRSYFSVSYSALLFREKENVHYFYRIDDAEFINNGHSRTISYGGLSSGKHLLQIYFSTGEANSPVASIWIDVIPPFWATWWFILACVLATISILGIIYRIRISKIKELVQVKERIARDIHDEMGSNISTISILSNVLRDKLRQNALTDKESQILEKISRLSTEAMEAASEIVWSVNPKNDSMKEIARRMRFIGSQLEDFGINFSFVVEGDMTGLELRSEIRNDFYLIYKEIITNIGKHSRCKNVSVVISFTRGFGEMTIRDDGAGFDIEKEQTGNGLKNMMSRATKMNGSLSIQSEIGKGTVTKIRFPI